MHEFTMSTSACLLRVLACICMQGVHVLAVNVWVHAFCSLGDHKDAVRDTTQPLLQSMATRPAQA